MEVMAEEKKGFKRTEVGLIPEDWEVKPFGTLTQPSRLKISANEVSSKLPCIELEHIKKDVGQIEDYSNLKEQKSLKTSFSKGNVLFGKLRPYLRKYYFAEFDGACSTEIWVFDSIGNNFNRFLFYLVQQDSFIEAANKSTGTHMPRADWNVIKEHLIAVPPTLAEQQAIATALSDVDELIRSLDGLIEKKEAIKKGTMQQLLTGKKRLPGFDGEWEVKRLGDLCAYINDGTHYTPKYVDHGVPFYSVENVVANNFSDVKYITEEEHKSLIKRCKPEKGDILLTRIGTLGITKMIDWDIDASIYVSLALLKPNESIVSEYLYTYTKSVKFVEDVKKRSLTNATPQKINMGEVTGIPISVPIDHAEQKAIAQILSDMDEELQVLRRKREKMVRVKEGMMQELLTGKTKLI